MAAVTPGTTTNAWDFFETCANPLIERIQANWRVALMDMSTVLSIAGIFATFLAGYTFLCAAFVFTAVASATAAFYMREVAALPELEIIKQKYEEENTRLAENNAAFQAQNNALTQTNAQLTSQVAQLTLQVTQMRACAEHIRAEVGHLQEHNGNLSNNVRALDQQILSSRALCEQISAQLGARERGIGEQLEHLKRYLADLSADNRVHERIQELAALQEQTRQRNEELHNLQLQYAATSSDLRAVQQALEQIRTQFDAALRESAQNNSDLRGHVSALATERQRIHDILDRHFEHGIARG